jgi:ATP-binding cassette, subfamily B, bacterial PglK
MLKRLRVLFHEVKIVGGAGLRKVPLVVVFMLLASALDLLGVALIAPFVGLLIGGGYQLPAVFATALGANPLRTLGLTLIVVFAVKALATFLLQGVISKLSESIRANLMVRLLHAYQHKPYRFHLNHNSAELSGRLIWYTQAFSVGFIGAGMRMAADSFVFIALGCLIAYVNPMALMVMIVVLGLIATLVLRVIRVKAAQVTESNARLTAEAVHSTNQALGGLREVRVLGCEDYFLARLKKSADGLVDTAAKLSVIGLVPRHSIEFGMIVFLVLLVFFSQSGTASGATLVPLMGLIGAAAVRLMPASTALLTSFTQIRSNRFAVAVLARDLAADPTAAVATLTDAAPQRPAVLTKPTKPRFARLDGVGVCFGYDQTSAVIQHLDFSIAAGETVGLVGPSGAGKSTLADLMLGFLEPTAGHISVNGRTLSGAATREWQSMVAYIPQQSYLIDDTLRRNVALGVADADIDDDAVRQALEDAQLGAVLARLPKGLDTQLGERGVRFSGGQRQRVSIARALYHDREFLVLDEATSALDVETEMEIVETIRALKGRKTILLIAHRESTLAVASRLLTLTPAQA